MAIKIEKYLLPDLSVARYFVPITNTPLLHVEHSSFKQLLSKLCRIHVFVHVLHVINILRQFSFQRVQNIMIYLI